MFERHPGAMSHFQAHGTTELPDHKHGYSSTIRDIREFAELIMNLKNVQLLGKKKLIEKYFRIATQILDIINNKLYDQ